MISTLAVSSEAPPLRSDSDGGFRVGSSRVLLDLVIHAFQNGATPEIIVQQFSSLDLSDVYAVIAYYLRHRTEVDTYLAQRDQQAEEVRKQIEAGQRDLSGIRARLLGRRRS